MKDCGLMRTTIRQIYSAALSGTRSAFTLMELLVVIAILALLMAFIVPRMINTAERARVVKTRTDVVQIASAWLKYFEHYKHWPISGQTAVQMDGNLTGTLLGDNGGGLNPDRIPFYDAQAVSTNGSGGAMVNGWSNPVYVQFDQDLDNSITVVQTTQTVGKSSVAFSLGTNNQQSVWITSW